MKRVAVCVVILALTACGGGAADQPPVDQNSQPDAQSAPPPQCCFIPIPPYGGDFHPCADNGVDCTGTANDQGPCTVNNALGTQTDCPNNCSTSDSTNCNHPPDAGLDANDAMVDAADSMAEASDATDAMAEADAPVEAAPPPVVMCCTFAGQLNLCPDADAGSAVVCASNYCTVNNVLGSLAACPVCNGTTTDPTCGSDAADAAAPLTCGAASISNSSGLVCVCPPSTTCHYGDPDHCSAECL